MSEITGREMLRHTLATLAYRGAKTVSEAPEGFGELKASETSRTPLEILAHIGDLLDWALSMAHGTPVWVETVPLPWNDEIERFFDGIRKFDEFLATRAVLENSAEKLFQGPVADALTHIGQIAMLRRIYNDPIKGENYFKADIRIGQVGRKRPANRAEFE